MRESARSGQVTALRMRRRAGGGVDLDQRDLGASGDQFQQPMGELIDFLLGWFLVR